MILRLDIALSEIVLTNFMLHRQEDQEGVMKKLGKRKSHMRKH